MEELTRVIFLDIDGVLNSRPQTTRDFLKKENGKDYRWKLSDFYLRNLSRIYKKYNDTKIVLTSCWKIHVKSNDEYGELLRNKLSEYGMEIYDLSPEINSDGEICTSRAEEVYEWLKRHPEIIYWVSIEDDSCYSDYKFENFNGSYHLCKTDYGTDEDDYKECGLDMISTHIALEILGGKYD